MKRILLLSLLFAACSQDCQVAAGASELLHLQRKGEAMQLIVDGQPFLMRGSGFSKNVYETPGNLPGLAAVPDAYQSYAMNALLAPAIAGCLPHDAALAQVAVEDAAPATASLIRPGEPWLDTDGQVIQAHSAGILYHQGIYYWYGENKSAPNDSPDGRNLDRVPVIGVSVYSSRDLVHWKNEGVVLKSVPDDPAHDLHPSKVCERPKVLFNARTKQFVMWWHMDSADYLAARAGVAVADHPSGPFRYLRSFRPINDQRFRDMNLFQDGDGQAYVFYASEDNATLYVSRLNDAFTDVERPTVEGKTWRRNFPGAFREAPAPFKHAGRYYLITSGCTGWNPNAADLAIAEHPLGPYVSQGNPCIGPGADKTFGAQSTFVLPVFGQPGRFIFLADRWDPKNLRDSRYAWLPFEVVAGKPVRIEWREAWSPQTAPSPPPRPPS